MYKNSNDNNQVGIITYNPGHLHFSRIPAISKLFFQKGNDSYVALQGTGMVRSARDPEVTAGSTEWHDYIIFNANMRKTYNPAGLMFLMPKGHRKLIRLIRTPTEDSLKGRVSIVVIYRKGVFLIFVNEYVNVQKQTKGYEPAENTREIY